MLSMRRTMPGSSISPPTRPQADGQDGPGQGLGHHLVELGRLLHVAADQQMLPARQVEPLPQTDRVPPDRRPAVEG